jgi:Tfp pilus assembly protein PilF
VSRFLAPAVALAVVVLVGTLAPATSDDVRVLGPADDAVVLQAVPPRAADARARAALAARPDDVGLAVEIARADIDRARRDSDPRYLGYAQAALRRWWDEPTPPHDVLVLRATIRQSNHEFAPALADLAAALRQDPDDPQAWLTQSVLLLLRGDFAGARRSCAPLARLTTDLVAAACVAGVDGITGHAHSGYDALARALGRARGDDPGTRAWALTLLAELAARLGLPDAAERRYRAALAAAPPDAYLLASYADFLLDAGRPAEVVTLLADKTSVDNLLLRLVEAEERAGARAASEHRNELAARYRASRDRGDQLHLREEARFLLHVMRDARTALPLAQKNFEIQREPGDVRILLEAAQAAGAEGAAQPARDWLVASGFEGTPIR